MVCSRCECLSSIVYNVSSGRLTQKSLRHCRQAHPANASKSIPLSGQHHPQSAKRTATSSEETYCSVNSSCSPTSHFLSITDTIHHVSIFRTISSSKDHSPGCTRLIDTRRIHEINVLKFTRYCYCENFATDTRGRRICSNDSNLHTSTWNERTRYWK